MRWDFRSMAQLYRNNSRCGMVKSNRPLHGKKNSRVSEKKDRPCFISHRHINTPYSVRRKQEEMHEQVGRCMCAPHSVLGSMHVNATEAQRRSSNMSGSQHWWECLRAPLWGSRVKSRQCWLIVVEISYVFHSTLLSTTKRVCFSTCSTLHTIF